MKIRTDNALMRMTKRELIEELRCAEHNQTAAEEFLAQHNENVKDWAPVVRCKDCENSYYAVDDLICSYGPCVDCPVPPDFWCAYGKRKEST